MESVHTIDIPADLVKVFESALVRRGISVGVTYHDDGSRSYRVEPGEWDEASVIRAAEESIEQLRAVLARHCEAQLYRHLGRVPGLHAGHT